MMTRTADNMFTSIRPHSLRDFLAQRYNAEVAQGRQPEHAEHLAWRAAQQAGWYETSSGWRRLAPDVRGKVNVRQGIKQPDGRYVIEDVDIFYPNAVKGADAAGVFTVEQVRRAISNTNRMISAGGQRPALTKNHPTELSKALGTDDAFGACVNFRESPRGEGWIRCDLVDVDPGLFEEMRMGRRPGLSAGLVNDAGDLNLRIGHVAALGAQQQALSQLPRLEVYSTASSRTVCFSADRNTFAGVIPMAETATPTENPSTEQPVATTPESVDAGTNAAADKTQMYAAMQNAYAGLQAAYASAAAGEPGAEAKLKEANEAFEAVRAQYCGTLGCTGMASTPQDTASAPTSGSHEDEEMDRKLVEEMLQKAGISQNNAAPVPEAEEDEQYAAGFRAGFEAASRRAFANAEAAPVPANNALPEQPLGDSGRPAAQSAVEEFAARLDAQDRVIDLLAKAYAAQTGKTIRADFAAFCDNLQREGHDFDPAKARAMFSRVAHDPEAVAALKDMLRASPRRMTALSQPTFSASDACRPTTAQSTAPAAGSAKSTDQEVLALLRQHMPGVDFSAEDIALGTQVVGCRR